MNRRSRFETVIGVALLLPWTIAPIVTGFYWRFMFQPSFGIATSIADALGLAESPIPWLQSTDTAMGVAVVATALAHGAADGDPAARRAQDDPVEPVLGRQDGRRLERGSRSATSRCPGSGPRCSW